MLVISLLDIIGPPGLRLKGAGRGLPVRLWGDGQPCQPLVPTPNLPPTGLYPPELVASCLAPKKMEDLGIVKS